MESSLSDQWVKCISTQGNIRGVALQAKNLVQEVATRHKLKQESIPGLGEALIGALLIGSYCKPGEHINLNIRGSGRYKQALVDAYPGGNVRGYIVEHETVFEQEPGVGPWGTGLLSVLRAKDGESGKPYIGTVPLLTGHLAKDLSFYWVQSEQIPSAVGIAIECVGDQVVSAGGFLVQALPGASASEVKSVEQHIQNIQSLAESLTKNSNPIHLLSQIFQSTAFVRVEEKPILFNCTCTWERVHRALVLVGVEELQAILLEDQSALVRCEFCGKEYSLDEVTLRQLIKKVNHE